MRACLSSMIGHGLSASPDRATEQFETTASGLELM